MTWCRIRLKAQGFTMDFWRIAMRPGKPLMFAAKTGPRRVIGFPGDPVSTHGLRAPVPEARMERMTGQSGRPAPLSSPRPARRST